MERASGRWRAGPGELAWCHGHVAPERDTTTSIVLVPSATPAVGNAPPRSVSGPRYRSAWAGAKGDVGRAIALATGGAIAFGLVEYVLTLWTYSGSVELANKVGLVALTTTLTLVLWLILTVATAVALVGARAFDFYIHRERSLAPGWFIASPIEAGIRRGVPVVWGMFMTAAVIGFGIQRGTIWVINHYKDPPLMGVVVGVFAIAGVASALPLYRLFALTSRAGADALAPKLGMLNPLGRWRAAGFALGAIVISVLGVASWLWPDYRSSLNVRLAISVIAIAFGMGMGARMHALPRRRARLRKHALVLAAGACALMMMTLLKWGANPGTKYIVVTASPALDQLIHVVRFANDLDRDGFGSLLGENDCKPFDNTIYPSAIDKPDDGIDQNCDGHDFSLRTPTPPPGPTLPMPAQFKKDWNVLFITIDTLRYDHTTFGGYADGPKHRDTTPLLDKLVKRATSFSFCNAPAAGTMASIPAILTSKFFHSGIALDETNAPGTPPRMKPENTLLPEIMKRAGYRTAVVASHEWWNDWGMDQGVDDYDNSIGKTADPWRVAADKVTDHVLAWISREQGHKWFMWAHYIDPHGRYVAHPDVVDYGKSEPDLYDAEVRWTDQQIGRLFDELKNLPSDANTIIVITSDHGDSMGEHTVPPGTHGTALYRELQHVPMIFYIPDNKPHVIGGAVTNLDIVPTLAEICGIDVHDLSFEGRSLVPAIFYGKEDHDRIVFAETNAPGPQRAAISEGWKLIYYLQPNLYELYDLKNDPWEHTNLASKNPPEMTKMREALDAWLERVVYARDPLFNQANERIADVLLKAAPAPAVKTQDQSLDGGKIEIVGIGLGAGQKVSPGAKIDVHVYFAVHDRSQIAYKFLLAAWPVDKASWKPADAAPPTMFRTGLRPTAEGFFPSDRWHANEFIRERFTFTVPFDWRGDALVIGLVATDSAGNKSPASGPAPANDPSLAILGYLPTDLEGVAKPTPPPDLNTGSSGSGRP
jgi:choline-sulfatase